MRRAVALLVACLMVLLAAPASAMEKRGGGLAENGPTDPWSWPERIPQYNTLLYAPLMAVDSEGVVHAFNLESGAGQDFSILHRAWTPNEGWSAPVDVLLPDYLGLAPMLMSVFLDREDMIHLVYYASSMTEGEIYYSNVRAVDAGLSQAWSEPVPIGPNAAGVAAAALGGNEAGELLMLYGGQREGLGLYAVHSVDGGLTWSDPASVWRAPGEGIWPTSISLTADDTGKLHAVWDTGNSLGQGVDIGYAQLSQDLLTWEHATTLARQAEAQDMVGSPSIIANGDDLIVVYQDGFPPTKMMRQSFDRGLTWSMPVRPFPHVGGYGDVAMVKDSLGGIHMILGNRYPIPEIHGMWYSRLVGGQWTPLEPIISGPRTDTFDPCCPEAVVCNGNVLLAAWPHNVSQEHLTGAWYAFRTLDAPPLREAPARPLATAASPSTPVPDAGRTPTPTVRTTPTHVSAAAPVDEGSAPAEGNPAIPVYVGIIPVVLLTIAAIARRNHPTRATTHARADGPPAEGEKP